MMQGVFFITSIVLATLALIYLYRVARGPTIFDRLLGLNGISNKAVLLLVVIGTLYNRLDMFVDISVGYALLNMVGALAVTKYFESKGTP